MSSKGVPADCHTFSLRIGLADVDAFDLVGTFIILETVSILANFIFMIDHILTYFKHRRSCTLRASSLPVGAAEVVIQKEVKATNEKNLGDDNTAVQSSRRRIIHPEDFNYPKRFITSFSSIADSVKLNGEGKNGI